MKEGAVIHYSSADCADSADFLFIFCIKEEYFLRNQRYLRMKNRGERISTPLKIKAISFIQAYPLPS